MSLNKSQVIPASLVSQGVDAADVVVARKAAKVYPVSGSVYKSDSNNIINWRISSNDYADFSALAMFFKLRVSNKHMTLDDLHSSIIERIVVQLNGTVIEDISHVNDLHKVLTYAHVPQGYYRNEMHCTQGAFKYVPSTFVAGGYYDENDFRLKRGGHKSLNMYFAGDNVRDQIDNDYLCINLATLLGIGRGYNGETKLFPLRFARDLSISITLAAGHRALVAFDHDTNDGNHVPAALDKSYTVDNPFLLYTAVELNQGWYGEYRKQLEANGYVGFYDSYYVVNKQIPNKLNDRHDIPLTISHSDIRANLKGKSFVSPLYPRPMPSNVARLMHR